MDKLNTKIKLDITFHDVEYQNLYEDSFSIEYDVGYDVTNIDLDSFFQEYKICYEFNQPYPDIEIFLEKEVKKRLSEDFFDDRDYVEVHAYISEIYFPNNDKEYIALEDRFEDEIGSTVEYEDIRYEMSNCYFTFGKES